MGVFVSEVTETMYQRYAAHQIDDKELKAHFCWQILDFAVKSSHQIVGEGRTLEEVFRNYSNVQRIGERD